MQNLCCKTLAKLLDSRFKHGQQKSKRQSSIQSVGGARQPVEISILFESDTECLEHCQTSLTCPTQASYVNEGHADSDYGEDMSDFSGSYRGSSSIQFEVVDDDAQSQV